GDERKMLQFRRFALSLTQVQWQKRQFFAVCSDYRRKSYVKAHYFTSVKKRPCMEPHTITERLFRARIRAGGKREQRPRARDSVSRAGDSFASCGGLKREARTSARRRGEFVNGTGLAASCRAARSGMGLDSHGTSPRPRRAQL